MGRKIKKGLDSYTFDVDFFQDVKIRKLIRHQGGKSIAVYTIILCLIYRSGYYIRWNKELSFIISEQSGYEESYIWEVVLCCLTCDLFDKRLFDSENILTSKGIQRRYMKINKACKRGASIQAYNCILSESSTKKHVDMINPVDTDKDAVFILDKEIEELKSSDVWLDSLQTLHHMTADALKQRIDEFRLKCIADGKYGHDNISDAKRHFSNWLRIVNNDKNRSDNRAGRRGHLLKDDKTKAYSNTF